MSTLPVLPSALIRVALADLKLCEANPNYVISMLRWHSPDEDDSGRCSVCFAGAVMAQSLGTDHTRLGHPTNFPGAVMHSLLALNQFRVGYVRAGLIALSQPAVMNDRAIVDYVDNRRTFHFQMHELADDLEEAGV